VGGPPCTPQDRAPGFTSRPPDAGLSSAPRPPRPSGEPSRISLAEVRLRPLMGMMKERSPALWKLRLRRPKLRSATEDHEVAAEVAPALPEIMVATSPSDQIAHWSP